MILYAAIAFIIAVGALTAVAPRTATGQPVRWVGFDGQSVVLIFMIYVAAHAFVSAGFAVSLLCAFALHEAGNVLAHRMLGRGETRFRLVPVLSDLTVQSEPFRSEASAFFVALMGAGFSLAPMCLAFGLGAALEGADPSLSQMLYLFGGTIGCVNFVLMLPFRPLNGGRCAELAARNFWPALVPGLAAFMIAAFMAAGLKSMSLPLIGLSLFGVASLFWRPAAALKPMGASAGLLALAAYVLTFAAHFMAARILMGMIG